VETLKRLHEVLHRRPELWPSNWIELQLTRHCQAVSGPKIDHWNETSTLIPWLGFKWLLALSKKSVGKDFRILKTSKKNVTMALEALPQQEFQKCFQQWQYHWAKCIVAVGEYYEVDASQ